MNLAMSARLQLQVQVNFWLASSWNSLGTPTIAFLYSQKQERPIGAKDWCDGADDWGEDNDVASCEDVCIPSPGLLAASDPFPGEGDCASQLQGLSLQEAPNISHLSCSDNPVVEEQNVPMWQPYYISAVEEDDYLGYSDTDHARKLLKEYQQREGVDLELLTSERWE